MATHLKNKLVVVTGASSGLGEASAKAFAQAGAHVALLARNRTALARVAAEIEAHGGRATVFPGDLTDPAAVERIASAITQTLGTPDVLLNNAGSGRWLFTDETSPREAIQAMETPYFSAFHLTRAFLPDMLSRGTGHILNVTSPVCFFSWPGASAYGVARWAIRGFTELLRADVAGTGLKVSLVCAGEMDTPYFDNNPGSRERIPRIARMYRVLQPQEVAHAIVRAVERGQRDVILPWLLGQTLLLQRFAPWLITWLVRTTGYKRPASAAATPVQPSTQHGSVGHGRI